MNNVNKCNLERAVLRWTLISSAATLNVTTPTFLFPRHRLSPWLRLTCRSENRCSAARSMKSQKKRSLGNGQSSRGHSYHFYYGILTRKAYRQRHYTTFLTVCRSETIWLSLRKPVLCCKVNQIYRNKKHYKIGKIQECKFFTFLIDFWRQKHTGRRHFYAFLTVCRSFVDGTTPTTTLLLLT